MSTRKKSKYQQRVARRVPYENPKTAEAHMIEAISTRRRWESELFYMEKIAADVKAENERALYSIQGVAGKAPRPRKRFGTRREPSEPVIDRNPIFVSGVAKKQS